METFTEYELDSCSMSLWGDDAIGRVVGKSLILSQVCLSKADPCKGIRWVACKHHQPVFHVLSSPDTEHIPLVV